MEIVTLPDFQTATEAGIFLRKLQALLRSIGASDGNMEEGSLRCDVNISVKKIGGTLGTRCEIKNLNSVKSVMSAIGLNIVMLLLFCFVFFLKTIPFLFPSEFEAQRHIRLLEAGENIQLETRGFDVSRGETFKLRAKEEAKDYRYMPEPDLPELHISEELLESCREAVRRSNLPDLVRQSLITQYGLSLAQCKVLMEEPGGVAYFEEVAKNRDVSAVMSWYCFIHHESVCFFLLFFERSNWHGGE